MPRDFTAALSARLLETVPADRAYPRADLNQAALPRPVVHFLDRFLDHRLSQERAALRRARSSWFAYDAPDVRQREESFWDALAPHARIPADAWERTLRQAAERTTLFLIRPAHTLVGFIFGDDDGALSVSAVRKGAHYFAAYPYLREAIEAYAEQKQLREINRTQLTALLTRVDQQITADHTADDWLRLLDPLFSLAAAADLNGVPARLLRTFFSAKDRPALARSLAAEDPDAPLTRAALRRLLIIAARGETEEEKDREAKEAEEKETGGDGVRTYDAPNIAASEPAPSEPAPSEPAPSERAALDSPTPAAPEEDALPAEGRRSDNPDDHAPPRSPAHNAAEAEEREPAAEDRKPSRESEPAEEQETAGMRASAMRARAGEKQETAAERGGAEEKAAGEQTPSEQTPSEQTPSEQTPSEQTPSEQMLSKKRRTVVAEAAAENEEAAVPRWKQFHGRSERAAAPPPAADRPQRPAPKRASAKAEAASTDARPRWQQFQPSAEAPSGGGAAADTQRATEPAEALSDLEADVLGQRGARNRTAFVRHLFDGSEDAYARVLRRLRAADDWAEASRIIAADVFRAHQVNIYSDAAVAFTDAVQARFR